MEQQQGGEHGAEREELEEPDEAELPEFERAEVAALMEDAEREQSDEELSFALIARRNLPDDFLAEAGPDAIATAVAGWTHAQL
jgi:hypothetical protein